MSVGLVAVSFIEILLVVGLPSALASTATSGIRLSVQEAEAATEELAKAEDTEVGVYDAVQQLVRYN